MTVRISLHTQCPSPLCQPEVPTHLRKASDQWMLGWASQSGISARRFLAQSDGERGGKNRTLWMWKRPMPTTPEGTLTTAPVCWAIGAGTSYENAAGLISTYLFWRCLSDRFKRQVKQGTVSSCSKITNQSNGSPYQSLHVCFIQEHPLHRKRAVLPTER